MIEAIQDKRAVAAVMIVAVVTLAVWWYTRRESTRRPGKETHP